VFRWQDGHGRTWTLQVGAERLVVEAGEQRFEIPQQRYAEDVYVSPMGGQAVVRLAGPDQDVGFLVTEAAARALLARLGFRPLTPDALARQEAEAAARRRPTWPKMTRASVWALICAALAFLPFVGVLLALAALVLVFHERRRTTASPAHLHIRWMNALTVGLVVWGLAVWALGTWTWQQPFPVERVTGLPDVAPGGEQRDWVTIVVSLVVVLISLSVHEAAHAITAWWCGDDFARSLGRVTLDPRAHIDPFGTVILPLMLSFSGLGVFGYARPVPVRLAGVPRYRRAHILVSLAGPGSNLLLAALSLSLLLAAGCLLRRYAPGQAWLHCWTLWPVPVNTFSGGAAVLATLMGFLKLSCLINVLLAAFNLIPVPPLDGSWVLEHLFPDTLGRLYARIRPFGFLIFIGLFMTGALHPLMEPGWIVLQQAGELLRECVCL